jgi:hypothetical protein
VYDELLELPRNDVFLFDVESFPNYFLVAFRHLSSGKRYHFEACGDERPSASWLAFMVDNFCLVGFNSMSYDLPVISAAASLKYTAFDLHQITRAIIVQGLKLKEIFEDFPFEMLRGNHIDLIEVAPLTGSLKTYAARLHCHHLQDLPFDPSSHLDVEQMAMVRDYCFNDLASTQLLLTELNPHLELRAEISQMFGYDMRSLSDAQLAQAIINSEIHRISGKRPKRPDFTKVVGTSFRYEPPPYVQFHSPELRAMLAEVSGAVIPVGNTGHVVAPDALNGKTVRIGGRRYTIGLGGLHSNETCQAVRASDDVLILDRDVTGYYPNLILKNRFAPTHLGDAFLSALQAIVDRRYKAKKAGNKVVADSLKIASNGTFGKLSDPYSTLYSPKMMVQTTLTGQLSLLMAIERLVAYEFEVISANTDGIVTLCPPDRYEEFCRLFTAWEKHTGLETEETKYAALYSRDVNNYIAVKPDGKTKEKGVYAEFGSALNSALSKNPEHRICMDAVLAKITKDVPIDRTIRECRDVRKFVTVRKVNGGAAKDGRYLGKTIRWYYAAGVVGCIQTCLKGHKVAGTDGGKPLMVLPDELPADIDYEKYIEIATGILEDIGFQLRRNSQLTFL